MSPQIASPPSPAAAPVPGTPTVLWQAVDISASASTSCSVEPWGHPGTRRSPGRVCSSAQAGGFETPGNVLEVFRASFKSSDFPGLLLSFLVSLLFTTVLTPPEVAVVLLDNCHWLFFDKQSRENTVLNKCALGQVKSGQSPTWSSGNNSLGVDLRSPGPNGPHQWLLEYQFSQLLWNRAVGRRGFGNGTSQNTTQLALSSI